MLALRASQLALVVKSLPEMLKDLGSTSEFRRSLGEGHGSPFQYSCLGNPLDRGAWWATAHGTADSWTQLSTGSSKKQESSRKKIDFCFIDYAKAFDCVDHSKLWKILKEMGVPDHLTCLLRNLYADQEATVRTGRGTTV